MKRNNTTEEERREARKLYRRKYSKRPERRLLDRVGHRARAFHKVPKLCSFKGCKTMGERHHPDYSKPLEIIWLCRQHHFKTHHNRFCSAKGCKNVYYAKGFCTVHYTKKFRYKWKPYYPWKIEYRKKMGIL